MGFPAGQLPASGTDHLSSLSRQAVRVSFGRLADQSDHGVFS
jgi:hypothetical protein